MNYVFIVTLFIIILYVSIYNFIKIRGIVKHKNADTTALNMITVFFDCAPRSVLSCNFLSIQRFPKTFRLKEMLLAIRTPHVSMLFLCCYFVFLLMCVYNN